MRFNYVSAFTPRTLENYAWTEHLNASMNSTLFKNMRRLVSLYLESDLLQTFFIKPTNNNKFAPI
ncbi:MAG: hypothetical protein AB7F59_13440 [Bdellovibrionales bacterium]